MRKWLILCAIPLLLCGCTRGEKMDPVLFCGAFNRRVPPQMRLHEQDALLRGEGEMLLWTDGVLLRLLTNADSAVHTAVVTAPASAQSVLLEAVKTAFTVLAEPLGEDAPASLEDAIRSAGTDVQMIRTRRFVYLIYGLPEALTVMQINSLYSPALPEQPTLRRS